MCAWGLPEVRRHGMGRRRGVVSGRWRQRWRGEDEQASAELGGAGRGVSCAATRSRAVGGGFWAWLAAGCAAGRGPARTYTNVLRGSFLLPSNTHTPTNPYTPSLTQAFADDKTFRNALNQVRMGFRGWLPVLPCLPGALMKQRSALQPNC